MKLEALHVGMRVKHPQYGSGIVRVISDSASDIQFDDGLRKVAPEASGLEPAEPQVDIHALSMPLTQFIQQTVDSAVRSLGRERPDSTNVQLGSRWHKGKLVMHPSDPTLQ